MFSITALSKWIAITILVDSLNAENQQLRCRCIKYITRANFVSAITRFSNAKKTI